MVTQAQFKAHFQSLLSGRAVYVWGGNGEIISRELMDRLYQTYGSQTYNRAYYNNKLAEGLGRIGADCSGAFFPLSRADNTARGYYAVCPVKGSVGDLPKNTACMVFNGQFTHVGAYMGDGTTIEMRSSARNVYGEAFHKSRWTYFGIPAWLETDSNQNGANSAEKPSSPSGGAPEQSGSVSGAQSGSASETQAGSPVKKGSAVIVRVQLWCNDYVQAGLNSDGIYGPRTKKALCLALQHYHNRTYGAGLAEDGIFGPKTKAVCRTVSGENELVYIAQAMLYCLGYDMSRSITGNNLDGRCGSGTKKAVLCFQQDHKGLRQDGLCGPATFYSMFR